MSVKVVIADDHEVVRRGLVSLLAGSEVKIVGEAASAEEALRKVVRSRPHLVLMDINLPGMTGLEASTRLQTVAPEVKVLILSVHDRREYVQQVARCGARGYVLKDASPAELIRAIYTVLRGGTYFSRRVAAALAKALKPGTEAELSERERAVLLGVAKGSSSKEIAERMGVAVTTVRTYRDRLRRKLDLHSVAAFTEYALQKGLMEREA